MIGRPLLTFQEQKRLLGSRSKEFTLQSVFKYGYRNKEDISNLPPNTLVVGSQNVLTNAAELVGIRNGYVLDGPAGTQNNYGIDSSYDFLTRLGSRENLRKWGSTLEVRYTNPVSGAVSWIALTSLLNPANVCNFTNFWDANTELKMFCLFVNGGNSVYEWSGGMASFASASATGIGVIAALTATPVAGGSQYAVGDLLNISGGSAGIAVVTATDPSGSVTGVSLQTAGNGYSNGNATTTTNNLGTGCILTITVSTGASITISGTTTLSQLGFYDNTANSAKFVVLINGIAYTYTGVSGTTFYGVTPDPSIAGIAVGNAIVQQVNSTLGGSITTQDLVTIANGGTGYTKGDILTIAGGTGGQVQVTDLNGTAITGLIVIASGIGYSVATGVAVSGGTGSSASVNVNAVSGGEIIPGANTSLGSNMTFDLIATLENQVWYGSFSSTNIYISQTDNYKSVAFSTPARLPAEGALVTPDAPPVGFSPQAGQMYVSCGTDQWWVSQKDQITVSTTSGANTVATPTETLYISRLKTALNQAAQSQGLIGTYKNSLVFVSNEQIINTLGLVQNIQIDPQVTNMSDPIKYDVDAYDFSAGQVLYDNYFIYISVPAMGVVRMYNVVKQYWEAPQLIPVGRFYHTNQTTGTSIYGHSSLTNESYQLFTGYNDNGNPVNAAVAFPYVCNLGGAPFEKKSFNKVYTEGYISANANLMLTINYDFGGYSGTYTTIIPGQPPSNIIFNKVTDGSLGQNSLGSQPIGSVLNLPNQPVNPKFRIISTMPRVDVFEYQIVYSSDDVDFAWSILRFGPAANTTGALPNQQTI